MIKMKIKEILKPFKEELEEFIKNFGDKEHSPDKEEYKDIFYIYVEEVYFPVDMKNSYWYEEDDGTIVFRVNDMTGVE